MNLIQLLFFFCGLLGLGSSWNQPGKVNSCYVRKTVCSSDSEYKEDIKEIRESLQDISTTLKVIAQNQGMTTEPPITTQSPPLEGSFENPASSCSDIPQNSPSGEYWIKNNSTNSPVQVYCDMNRTCSCNNITGGWMRVASLDMSDPNQQCPDGFELMTSPIRTCIRPRSNSSVRAEQSGCVSTTYPTNGVEYSHVCGKIVGYQYGPTAAFESYIFNLEYGNTIDEQYVTGVSLTHGQSPREHIWTFQASISLSTSSMDG